MTTTPHSVLTLIHDVLGSTGRTVRAIALLAAVHLFAGGSVDLLHALGPLLHR